MAFYRGWSEANRRTDIFVAHDNDHALISGYDLIDGPYESEEKAREEQAPVKDIAKATELTSIDPIISDTDTDPPQREPIAITDPAVI